VEHFRLKTGSDHDADDYLKEKMTDPGTAMSSLRAIFRAITASMEHIMMPPGNRSLAPASPPAVPASKSKTSLIIASYPFRRRPKFQACLPPFLLIPDHIPVQAIQAASGNAGSGPFFL
jgi:hypothetical protein